MSPTPEQKARQDIDAALAAAGWIIQDRPEMNLAAGAGVAVREFRMMPGHGFADYLLFVNGKAVGALEAKPAGYRLINVELRNRDTEADAPAWTDAPTCPGRPSVRTRSGASTRIGKPVEFRYRTIPGNTMVEHRQSERPIELRPNSEIVSRTRFRRPSSAIRPRQSSSQQQQPHRARRGPGA